ncbi:hypothetical protein D9613_010691 [Agrocybe pediades]|uniref:SET domain-containing protein n=1 Tax=Agrocybe pediades TaxID=84607 RepID=A0A8H4QFS3_9AGAR|nr:hypothetical protein D9613_010691 [Agrocybe pediades]
MSLAPYDILPTPYGGRGAFARRFIPKGSPVLLCSGPYATVIFWKFRREVCATCFAYAFESGKRKWSIKLGENSRGAGGVWFCSEECKDAFVQDYELVAGQGIGWWGEINGAFERMLLQMGKDVKPTVDPLEDITAADVTAEFIEKTWLAAEQSPPGRGWTEELSEYELDTARFVLDGLVHKVMEEANPAFPSLDRVVVGAEGYCVSAGRWADLMELQDNELAMIKVKPYTLASRIRLYRFLRHLVASLATRKNVMRSGSATPEGTSMPLIRIADRLKSVLSTSLAARALMARDHGNVFGIWDMASEEEGSEMLGWAAYVSGSYFNHDCSPNLKKDRVGRAIQFRALRDILPGEEMCISYIDEDCPDPKERSRQLEQDWFFACCCSKCKRQLTHE